MNIELLRKYIAGETDERETRQVVEWIAQSDANRREYMEQRKLYDIALWNTKAVTAKKLSANPRYSLKWVLRETLKVAALVAVVFTFTYYWMSYRNATSAQSLQSIYAPAGQRSEIRLSDGTRVWLNSCSRLTYSGSFDGDYRNVKLEGEAYFIVSKNKEKPFIVEAGKYRVRVLGTEFNVSAYPANKEWRTSLMEGSVMITDTHGNSLVELQPNTEAYVKDGRLMKSGFNSTEPFSWRRGLLSFTNLPMYEMVKKFELYYGIRIIVNNKSLLGNSYTGKFFIGDGIEHALDVLKIDNRFTYLYDSEKQIITIN